MLQRVHRGFFFLVRTFSHDKSHTLSRQTTHTHLGARLLRQCSPMEPKEAAVKINMRLIGIAITCTVRDHVKEVCFLLNIEHINSLITPYFQHTGYTCNATSGQCQLTDAGSGDTLKNCEASCHKQPKDLSVCNTSTLTCEPCKDYCTSDSDCPGSYCKAGLCAHSRCQAQSSCNASCAAVPQEIIGVWRGVQIQEGYGSGEYDLRFNNSVNSSQVQFRGPQGDVSNGDVEATPGTQNLVLTFTSGPLANTILRGLYSPWEPSVDTLTMAYAFGAPNEDAPDSIETAMKGNGSTVYVLSSCNPHTDTKHCDFSSVFEEEEEKEDELLTFLSSFLRDHPKDPCAVHPTCGTCIGDASQLCGWCTSNVTYNNGSDVGARCAGYVA